MKKKTGKITYILTIIFAICAVIVMCAGNIFIDAKLRWMGLMLMLVSVLLAISTYKDRDKKPAMKVIVVFMVFLTVVFLWGDDIFMALMPKPKVYEMTEEEKAWMKKNYIYDEESIEKGHLLPSQLENLEKGRAGLVFVEEKYPGYEFKLTYIEDMMNMVDYGVKEEKTGYHFDIYIRENEDGTLQIKDNFYVYLFEDKYEAYLEEQIKEKVKNAVTVDVGMSGVEGREYDSSMTVEDIVSGRLEIYARNYVSITASGKNEEECRNDVEGIQQGIEETGLYGVYTIYFWDMTEEEMLLAEEYAGLTYKYIFQFFEEEEEEK